MASRGVHRERKVSNTEAQGAGGVRAQTPGDIHSGLQTKAFYRESQTQEGFVSERK